MKLGPVTKSNKKKKKKTPKNLTMKTCRQIATSLSFSDLWPIWGNPQTGLRTSVKLTFSLTVTFSFTKTENGTKNL